MNKVIEAVKRYLLEVLDVRSEAHPWKAKDKLPHFLTDSYDFYEILLLDTPCLLMVPSEATVVSPAVITKHRKQVLEKWRGGCIYVQEAISAHNRQRLIQHRVPFITPGNQMYLPDLGIDLREYFQQSSCLKENFSPSTQAVIIYALCDDGAEGGYTASELVKDLGYSRMTLMRAFNELEHFSIGTTSRKGRERLWGYKSGKQELWEQAKPLLSTPVKRRTWVEGMKAGILAGLSALAEYSMLNGPNIPVYAVDLDEWKNLKERVKILSISEGATAELEIWEYSPKLFAKKGIVDPFSLYLSLKKIKDERIEDAIENMMEDRRW